MAQLNINLPIVSKSFYTSIERPQVKAMLDKIYAKYKGTIDSVAKINNVEPKLITSVIFIESRGDANAQSKYAVGLMQLAPNSCTDLITRQRKANKLTQSEKLLLLSSFGKERYDKIMKAKMGDDFVTKADLLKPDVNIILGTMYLSELIDAESSDGQTRLDRVILRYNKGFYYNPPKGTAEQLMANVGQESKDYVLKLGGVGGTLQLLT